MEEKKREQTDKPEGHHLKEEMGKPVENPGMTKGIRNIIILLGVLIAIGVIGFVIYRLLSGRDKDASETAEQVRQAFETPDTGNPVNNPSAFTPPQPGTWTGPMATSTADQGDAAPVEAAPAASRETTTQSPTAAPTVYQNPAYGFSYTLPSGWVADDRQAPGQVYFFDGGTGRLGGYAEIYDAGSSDLDSLAGSLTGSPEVSSVTETTFAGQPALSFHVGPDTGIASIYNGRIYYLRGVPADPLRFRFMN